MRSLWAAFEHWDISRLEICVNTAFVLLSRAERPSKSTPNFDAIPDDATKMGSFWGPIDDDLEPSSCDAKAEWLARVAANDATNLHAAKDGSAV